MSDNESRFRHAQAALDRALEHERRGRLDAAYMELREAHDAVVDCPGFHRAVHRCLVRVNWHRRSYREMAIDMFLLLTGPLGSFELVAYLMKGQIVGGAWCRRT